MGGIFRAPKAPPPPPPPPAPIAPPKASDAGQMAMRKKQKKYAGAGTGMSGTNVTGGQGILKDATTTEPTLLGS